MRINLIVWEKEHGYKSKWVAEKIGISNCTYSKIKNGKQEPSYSTLLKFRKAFPDVDVLELFIDIQVQ